MATDFPVYPAYNVGVCRTWFLPELATPFFPKIRSDLHNLSSFQMLKFKGDVVRVCRCLATLNTNIWSPSALNTDQVCSRAALSDNSADRNLWTASCQSTVVQSQRRQYIPERHDIARDTLSTFPFHPATTSTSPLHTITASHCLQCARK